MTRWRAWSSVTLGDAAVFGLAGVALTGWVRWRAWSPATPGVAFGVAGVALGDICAHTPFFYTQLLYVHLCRAQPFHEHFFDIHLFHTHAVTSLPHDIFHIQIFHRLLLNAQLFPSHTSLPHAALSQTTFSHAPSSTLAHATLSQETLSHTTLYNYRSFATSTFAPSQYRFNHCLLLLAEVELWVIRSFNFAKKMRSNFTIRKAVLSKCVSASLHMGYRIYLVYFHVC